MKLFSFFFVVPQKGSCLKGLYKTVRGTTKECKNKNLTEFLFHQNFLKCTCREGLNRKDIRALVLFHSNKTYFHIYLFVTCPGNDEIRKSYGIVDAELLASICNLEFTFLTCATVVTQISHQVGLPKVKYIRNRRKNKIPQQFYRKSQKKEKYY